METSKQERDAIGNAMMKLDNTVGYSLPVPCNEEDLRHVSSYNPFVLSPSYQNVLRKKYRVPASNSLGRKKVEHSLFVGGESLRKLGTRETRTIRNRH